MIEYVVVYAHTITPGTTWVPLILKAKPSHLKGMYNLPGGKIEPGEDAITAALRELEEETGLEEVQEPGITCHTEYMGRLDCLHCVIHAIKVPITFQPLKQHLGEIEKVDWFSMPELYGIPNLMPNLRVVMPLMDKDVKGWVIRDLDGDWRDKSFHNVNLSFDDLNNPWAVSVRSVAHYQGNKNEIR